MNLFQIKRNLEEIHVENNLVIEIHILIHRIIISRFSRKSIDVFKRKWPSSIVIANQTDISSSGGGGTSAHNSYTGRNPHLING